MKKLILLAIITTSSMGWAGTCGNGYSFSRQIQLRRAYSSDQTSYPYVLNGTQASTALQTAMKVTGSGGSVQNTTTNSISRTIPADVVFCDASNAGNALKYEIDGYDGTVAGKWTAYVQIPTLHTASTDSIWVFVGNASVSTSQEDLSMWSDISCAAVWHFPNGSTLDAKDSCPTNALNGTINGTVTATTDAIAGSATFAGATSSNIAFDGTTNYANTGSPFSVSWWGMPTSFSNNYPVAVTLHTNDTGPTTIGYSGDSPNYNGILMGGNNLWAHIHSGTTPRTVAYTYAGVAYNGSGPGTIANYNVVQNGSVATMTLSGSFGAITNENKIGTSSNSANSYIGKIDELRIFSRQNSNNWGITDFLTQAGAQSTNTQLSWKATPYVVQESLPTTPTIRQYVSCNTDMFGGICPLSVPVASGNLLVIVQTTTDALSSCTIPTDSLSLTFTARVSLSYAGTIHSYQTCILTAPVTTSGIETITLATVNVGSPANVAANVFEMIDVGTASIATTTSPTSGVIGVLSATSPAANSFLVCGTRDEVVGSPPPTVPSTSEGYAAFQSGYNDGDHPSSAYTAYAVVGTGTQTCTLSSGNGAVMAIFGPSPSVSKKRPSQVY
jgi:hypothetical protein